MLILLLLLLLRRRRLLLLVVVLLGLVLLLLVRLVLQQLLCRHARVWRAAQRRRPALQLSQLFSQLRCDQALRRQGRFACASRCRGAAATLPRLRRRPAQRHSQRRQPGLPGLCRVNSPCLPSDRRRQRRGGGRPQGCGRGAARVRPGAGAGVRRADLLGDGSFDLAGVERPGIVLGRPRRARRLDGPCGGVCGRDWRSTLRLLLLLLLLLMLFPFACPRWRFLLLHCSLRRVAQRLCGPHRRFGRCVAAEGFALALQWRRWRHLGDRRRPLPGCTRAARPRHRRPRFLQRCVRLGGRFA